MAMKLPPAPKCGNCGASGGGHYPRCSTSNGHPLITDHEKRTS